MSNLVEKARLAVLKKMKFLPPERYVGYYFQYYTGKKYHDDHPVEFYEKIQWYKAHYHPPILNRLVDKYAVREYVREKIGAQYLNDCIAVYDSPWKVDFDALPDRFVLKGVHGYGYNLIVSDKSKLNRTKARYKLCKWFLRNQYYRGGLEWAYKDIKPRFVAEKYLEELERDSITDYKFYCFSGKPKFLEVHLDRSSGGHRSGYFTLDFEPAPYNDVPPEKAIRTPPPKPENFEEMKQLAEKLADRFPFVRVDFYSIRGKTIFGEMTFYPSDGRCDFYPQQYNRTIGDLFVLPRLSKGEKTITVY